MQCQSPFPASCRSQDIDGAGRGLVAAKPIKAGEMLLRNTPLLLTPSQDMHKHVCANCLRFVQGKQLSKLLAI